jgi:chaperonin GroEL
VRKDAGDMVSRLSVDDLGHAQTVVCSRGTFTLIGTQGNPREIRERIRTLQSAREHAEDRGKRDEIDERIGKLLGGTALLHVSGQTKEDRDRRKEVAEMAVQVVRQGLQGGIVPGGGVAYIAAMSVLDGVELSEDEAPARDIVRRALQAPLTCLARNAGYDPGPVIARVQDAPAGSGFDVLSGEYVDVMAENIVDPLPTVTSALAHGFSAASMALTTNALVHRSYRDQSPTLNP